MIARRLWPLMLLLMAGFAAPAPADAQIWEKAREAARKAEEIARLLRTAVRCTFTDEQCIASARAGNKPVVLTDEQGKVITDEDGKPVTDPDQLPPGQKAQVANANRATSAAGPASLENELEAGTVVERYGAIDRATDQFLISEDGAHAAVPGLQGSRQVIIVDGKPGPAFDQVEFNTLRFSPTGGRHAYRARRGAECVVVVDGTEVSALPLAECTLTEFLFTRDGSHVAWLEVTRNNARMFTSTLVVDGRRATSYTGPEQPRLFVRGDHIFHADSTRVYVDQKPDSAFGIPSMLIASDDGSHYAYVAGVGSGRVRVIVDGKPGAAFPAVSTLYMEKNSGAVLYHVTTGDSIPGPGMSRQKLAEQAHVFRGQVYRRSQVGAPVAPSPHERLAAIQDPGSTVIDAVTNEPQAMIAISRDGKRFAFATTVPNTGRAAVFADGRLGTSYESVSAPRFTGDGTRLFYTATSGGRQFAVVDGTESDAHDRIWDVVIGNRNAYAYRIGGLGINPTYWVVNGKLSDPVKVYSPGTFTFSPDGAHYAFAGETPDEYFTEVDGERTNHGVMMPSGVVQPSPTGGPAKGFSFPAFAFSADGNRHAYLAMAGDPGRFKPVVMLDGEQITEPGDHYTHLAFSPSGKHFAYLRSRTPPQGPDDRYPLPPVWVLHIDGRTGPVVGGRLFINPKTVSFIDDNTIRVLAVQDGEIIRHTVSF